MYNIKNEIKYYIYDCSVYNSIEDLLASISYKTETIDKDKCFLKFEDCYNKEKALIEWIKANKIKILNSGIKVA